MRLTRPGALNSFGSPPKYSRNRCATFAGSIFVRTFNDSATKPISRSLKSRALRERPNEKTTTCNMPDLGNPPCSCWRRRCSMEPAESGHQFLAAIRRYPSHIEERHLETAGVLRIYCPSALRARAGISEDSGFPGHKDDLASGEVGHAVRQRCDHPHHFAVENQDH